MSGIMLGTKAFINIRYGLPLPVMQLAK